MNLFHKKGCPSWIGLLIIYLSLSTSFAQSSSDISTKGSGGIKAAVWYRPDVSNTVFSDAGTTSIKEGESVQQWNNVYGTGNNLQAAAASHKPVFQSGTNLTNFHPTINFTASHQLRVILASGTKVMDRAQGGMYLVGLINSSTTAGLIGFSPTMAQPGIRVVSTGQVRFSVGSINSNFGPLVTKGLPFISGATWKNGSGSSSTTTANRMSFNGSQETAQTNNIVLTAAASEPFHIGRNSNQGGITGQINEVVVFDRQLSSEELNRVDSYFAIKYGVTLADGVSYTRSSGATIWNAADSEKYHHNIGALIHDSASDLRQNQSRSTTSEHEILIGTTGLSATNATNTTSLRDGQALVWGDNGKSKTPIIPMPRGGKLNYHFAAIWKVQNTQATGTVRVAWQKRANTNWVLVVSNDETIDHSDAQHPMTNEITLNGITYNYVDVAFGNQQYFTLATADAGPGGILPAVWYRSDEEASHTLFSDLGVTRIQDNTSIKQWNDYYERGINLTGNRLPSYSASASLTNFHPTVTTNSNTFLTANAPNEYDIIDRADGSIYIQAKGISNRASGIFGFGTATREPGFVSPANGVLGFRLDASKLSSIPSVLPLNQNYVMGGTWANNGDATGTQVQASMSINGTRNQFNTANITPSASSNLLQLGYSTSAGYYNGDVNEMVVFEHPLTSDERDRLESYFALKYGTSKAYGNGTLNYYDAKGSIVWDAAKNEVYKFNIAGLARDSRGSLNQKQAWSTHSNQEILITTTGLANTNGANTVALQEGQYLIWGDNDKPKEPTVSLGKHPVLNYRFEAIWRVQNTNQTGTIRIAWPRKSILRLAVMLSDDEHFDEQDTYVPMNKSQEVNGVMYDYADLILTDGIYFTLAATHPAPGGVMPAVWYRSDAEAKHTLFSDANATPAVGDTPLYQWNDYLEKGADFKASSATRIANLSNVATLTNFHPTVTIGPSSWLMANPPTGENIIDRGDGSIYIHGKTKQYRAAGIFGFGPSAREPGFVSPSTGVLYYRTNSANLITSERIPLDSAYTLGGTWANYGDPTGTLQAATMSLNGERTQATFPIVNFATSSNYLQMGYSSSAGYYSGDINEAIVFEHQLSEDELNRVESYFALKYGSSTTYSNGARHFLNSNGEIVWNAESNAAYRYNIAGLAHDSKGGLNQKQAWSTHSNQEVLIATTGLANSNGANTKELREGQYLIWGDNNKVKEPVVHMANHSALNYRFEAVWKVQNTNQTDTVRIAWPQQSILQLVVILSQDEIIDNNDPYIHMDRNMEVNGTVYSYADLVLKDGIYFTLAAIHPAPGGVMPSVWYRSDEAATKTLFSDEGTTNVTDNQLIKQWNDYLETGHNFQQSNASRLPTYRKSGANLANFHPTVLVNANKWMTATPATDTDIIDRNDGTLYMQGKMLTRRAAGIFGFGEATRQPGFVSNAAGFLSYRLDASKLMSPERRTNLGENIVLGGSWANNTAGAGTLSQATYSTNGTRTDYEWGNLNPTEASKSLRFGYSTSAGFFNGHINEMIAFEHRLNTDEHNRVETYFALKYGNSFSYSNGTRHYLNSNSEVVWDANTNAEFRFNIAGIGRDEKGGLNQKQAWSTNSNREILISTTGLANTNGANQTALTNGQFLIWGDNGKPKAPGVFMPHQRHEEINFRFEAIWKVQNTNNVGTVRVAWPRSTRNFSLIQSTDTTFTNLVITPMNQSITINGTDYVYADVTFDNNTYFTLGVHGKAPGGILRGLSHWYRADQAVTTNGTTVTEWEDLISTTKATQVNQAPTPVIQSGRADYLNFNPGINFTSTAQMLGNLSAISLDSTRFDIISVVKENKTGNRFLSIGRIDTTGAIVANAAHPGLNINGQVVRKSDQDRVVYSGTPRAFSTTSPSILLHRFTTTTTSAALNGGVFSNTAVHDSVRLVQGPHIMGANNGDAAGFEGNLAELFIFGQGNLSTTERRKIETYLALKYGITLQSRSNYITSNDVVIWNTEDNVNHLYNVAGIGTDATSTLSQKQSRSQVQNTNSQVTIAVGTLATDNLTNSAVIPDGQFLVWGDNNNKTPMTNVTSSYTNVRYMGKIRNGSRMRRTWKVQNTGIQQAVDIRFPVASVGATTLLNDACAINALVVAKNTSFTNEVTFIPLSIIGDEYQANFTFPEGYSYFSFARIVPSDEAYVYLPNVPESTNEHDSGSCVDEWIYYNKVGQEEQKILALFGYEEELTRLVVNIHPQGYTYSDTQVTTKLMPRITSLRGLPNQRKARIVSSDSTIVRVYYSQAELNNTNFAGHHSSGWFFYPGTEIDIYTDLENDGLLDPLYAQPLQPSNSGVEDGARYVEFTNVATEGSFIYVASSGRSVLPVNLISFQVTPQENSVDITWKTTEEINNDYFEVQRSTNTEQWQTIGKVVGKQTSSVIPVSHYHLSDQHPLVGINYYRLKQVDKDGSYEYSRYQSITFDGTSEGLSLYPNPVNEGKLQVHYQGTIKEVEIIDMHGKVVAKPVLNTDYKLQFSLPPGIYLMKFKTDQQTTLIKTIIVQ